MDWVKEAIEVNKKCAEEIPNWTRDKYCGPNELVAGKSFSDKMIVYKNYFSNLFFLDQLEPAKTLEELKTQLANIMEGIKEYERKN